MTREDKANGPLPPLQIHTSGRSLKEAFLFARLPQGNEDVDDAQDTLYLLTDEHGQLIEAFGHPDWFGCDPIQ